MNENMITKPQFVFKQLYSNALVYGVIGAALLILSRITFYVIESEMFSQTTATLNFLINVIVLFVVGYLGTRNYRNTRMDNFLNYGVSFLSCSVIAINMLIITYFYDLLFNYVIDPDFITNSVDKYINFIISNPQIAEFQKKEIIKQMSVISETPFKHLSLNLLNSIIISVFLCLIIALFAKKTKK